ncbi:MAG: HK97 gp10 family phage protein, partial [Selenomonadaceae bacterium]|nr:HK97 gp10 family phage protein [Selenomonadaceae bacterium]
MGGRRNHYKDVGFARGRMTGRSVAKTIAELREMGEHVVEAAKAELKKGVDVVLADAKSRCPVRTGRLRDSIKAVSNKDGTVYWLSANASVESPKSPTGRFYYGAAVEFSPKINKPFMYPALEAHRQEIWDNVANAIQKAAARSG